MNLILVDENIPGARELLAPLGRVELFRGRELSAEQAAAATALLVRSVTPVNASLLGESRVGFVGSTTIGTDHMDTAWLDRQGIRWCNAPGSNAQSVVDYCVSAICALPGVLERLTTGGRVGIIGYGNVGCRLHRQLEALAIDCVAYDPFLTSDQCPILSSLDEVLHADFLSLHTPLTRSGEFPTFHMLALAQLQRLPEGAVLLNAGRGEVLATVALLALAAARPDIRLVLDVWEHEPNIAAELVAVCALATPHIAGYSQDGKWSGLMQVARALSEHLGIALADVAPPLATAPAVELNTTGNRADALRALVLGAYDIRRDDQRLREALSVGQAGVAFDELRRRYPVRREISAVRVIAKTALPGELREALVALGVSALLTE